METRERVQGRVDRKNPRKEEKRRPKPKKREGKPNNFCKIFMELDSDRFIKTLP